MVKKSLVMVFQGGEVKSDDFRVMRDRDPYHLLIERLDCSH